eukprot:7108771-Alexandrium_andersonii.AAC.1
MPEAGAAAPAGGCSPHRRPAAGVVDGAAGHLDTRDGAPARTWGPQGLHMEPHREPGAVALHHAGTAVTNDSLAEEWNS